MLFELLAIHRTKEATMSDGGNNGLLLVMLGGSFLNPGSVETTLAAIGVCVCLCV